MRLVEAVHDVAPALVDRAQVLEQAAERAIDVELNAAVEDGGDAGGSAQDLVTRNHHQAQRRDQQHAEPLGPAAERALLGDRHDQAHRVGQAAPRA